VRERQVVVAGGSDVGEELLAHHQVQAAQKRGDQGSVGHRSSLTKS
jgi:hypothetical protein